MSPTSASLSPIELPAEKNELGEKENLMVEASGPRSTCLPCLTQKLSLLVLERTGLKRGVEGRVVSFHDGNMQFLWPLC